MYNSAVVVDLAVDEIDDKVGKEKLGRCRTHTRHVAVVRPLVDADVDFLDCSGRWSEVGVATHYSFVKRVRAIDNYFYG